MNKLLIALLAAAVSGGAAFAADAPQPQPAASAPVTAYWLHPKLGMVKIYRDTGFMVVAGRQPTQAPRAATPAHDHARMHKLM